MKSIREPWNNARRAENPEEALAIDDGRKAIDWARRALMLIGVTARRATRWDSGRIMKQMLTSQRDSVQRGYPVFGFTVADAAQTRRIINAEQRKRF